ncbi:MAG: hypothetical protein ACHQHP_02275 [Bacteroidia bacterium]
MKKITQLVVFLFLAGKIFSQDGGSTKITIFQPGGVKTEDEKKPPPLKNLIKWNYSLVTRGVFLLNYELILSDKLSGEVGAGLTYRDFIFEVLKHSEFIDYTNTKVNFAFEGALRFYPKGNKNFEGLYLSPAISYRSYSFAPQQELYGSYFGYNNSFSPGYNFLDLQLKFGYQYESWWLDDLTTDFYIGFGYRSATVKYYEVNTNSYSNAVTAVTKTDSYPQALLGFKIGIAF